MPKSEDEHPYAEARKLASFWSKLKPMYPAEHEPPPEPKPKPKPKPEPNNLPPRPLPEKVFHEKVKKYRKLAKQAEAGDTAALDQLREQLGGDPIVWRTMGDIQRRTEHELIKKLFGTDVFARETFRQRISELRSQVYRPGDSIVTEMACSRVVTCWCFTQYFEYRALHEAGDRQLGNLLVQAEKRYQTAMKTLEMARKLDRERVKQRASDAKQYASTY